MKAISLPSSTFAVVALVCAAAMGACASYTATPGDGGAVPAGALTGPCYPNGTCNEGLRCESGVCADNTVNDASALPEVLPSDSGSDASTTSDASDASKPPPCDRTDTGEPAGVVDCIDVSCINQSSCCSTMHTCSKPCGDGIVAMACDGRDDCPGGSRCCGSHGGSAIDTSMCPRKNASPVLTSVCSTACSANEFDLCTAQSQCEGGKRCTRLDANIAGVAFSLGFCE